MKVDVHDMLPKIDGQEVGCILHGHSLGMLFFRYSNSKFRRSKKLSVYKIELPPIYLQDIVVLSSNRNGYLLCERQDLLEVLVGNLMHLLAVIFQTRRFSIRRISDDYGRMMLTLRDK
jgi:hypothetical protein